MSFTNSQLAQKISDMIDHWSGFAEEYANWLAGTVGGGTNSDGKYPLTDWLGVEYSVTCPAQLEDDVTGLAASASSYADSAFDSAAAAATSEATASTQAGLAATARSAAETAETNAETAESGAVDAKVTAIAQAAAALTSATNASSSASAAATSEANASTSEDAAAASAVAAAASAIEAATFEPSNYALLAGATFTGDVVLGSNAGLRSPTSSDASLTSTGHAFQIGATSGNNLICDANEILARNNGAAGDLFIQGVGGSVTFGGGTSLTEFNVSATTIELLGELVLSAELKINPSSDHTLKASNAHGYIQFGPENANNVQFRTDLPGFYFEKKVTVNGPLVRFNGGAHLHYNSDTYASGKIYVTASTPGSPSAGDIWFDIS